MQQRLLSFLLRYQCRILWSVGVGIFVLLSVLCVAKYHLFLYDGIDLAYFTQVFWNFLHGRAFTQSIHPHASLGDHAEFAIPFLVPLFALFPDPRTLLVLQAATLIAPAIVIFLIARWYCPQKDSLVPFVCTLLYLLNPLVHNIAIFEFHVLAFAVLPLMLAVYGYATKNARLFFVAMAAALLVREDVSLVVVGFGLLAWLEQRSWWWRITPILLGMTWFVGVMQFIGGFAPAGHYKFLVYYAWLGDSFGTIFLQALTHPLQMLRHFLTLGNLEMFLAFLMATAFLPLLAVSPLLLSLGPLAQILLGAPGGSAVVTSTHYSTLFLPGLVLATVYGARRIAAQQSANAIFGLLILVALYASVMLGPVQGAVRLFSDRDVALRANDFRNAIQDVPRDSSVVASYRALPHLAMRERLYSLHYVFLGVTQFREQSYALPVAVDTFVIDPYDAVRYRAQFLHTTWSSPNYAGGFARVNSAIADVCPHVFANVVVLQRCDTTSADMRGAYSFALPSWATQESGVFILGPAGTTEVIFP